MIYVISIVLWIGAVNKLVQVRRAPDDLPLRAVGACVVCVALVPALSLPPVSAGLEAVAGGLTKLLVNIITLIAMYSLLAFFRYSASGAAAGRAMRIQMVPLVTALLTMVTAWTLAPIAVRRAPAALANGRDPRATVFVVATLGYLGYCLVLTLRWAAICARSADQPRLRRALSVMSVALAALLCATAAKLLVAGTQLLTFRDPAGVQVLNAAYIILVLLGVVLFVAGVSYPAVASMAAGLPLWRRHRRLYRDLEPLWRAIHAAFPDLTLDRVPSAHQRTALLLRRTHRAYYRRVIEIRDGLVQLGPYCDVHAAEQAEVAARRAGHHGTRLTVSVQAAMVAAALDARKSEVPAANPRPFPVAGGQDLDSDALWLAQISRTMASASSQS